MIHTYRYQQREVDAVQFQNTTDAIQAVWDFLPGRVHIDYSGERPRLLLDTRFGPVDVHPGDWIIEHADNDPVGGTDSASRYTAMSDSAFRDSYFYAGEGHHYITHPVELQAVRIEAKDACLADLCELLGDDFHWHQIPTDRPYITMRDEFGDVIRAECGEWVAVYAGQAYMLSDDNMRQSFERVTEGAWA